MIYIILTWLSMILIIAFLFHVRAVNDAKQLFMTTLLEWTSYRLFTSLDSNPELSQISAATCFGLFFGRVVLIALGIAASRTGDGDRTRRVSAERVGPRIWLIRLDGGGVEGGVGRKGWLSSATGGSLSRSASMKRPSRSRSSSAAGGSPTAAIGASPSQAPGAFGVAGAAGGTGSSALPAVVTALSGASSSPSSR